MKKEKVIKILKINFIFLPFSVSVRNPENIVSDLVVPELLDKKRNSVYLCVLFKRDRLGKEKFLIFKIFLKGSTTPINSSNRDKEEQQIKPSTSDQQQQLTNRKENKNSFSSKETIYAAPPTSEINIKEKENKRNINSSTPRRHQQHSLIKKQISSSNPESTIQGGQISTLDQKKNLNNIKKSKFCLIM